MKVKEKSAEVGFKLNIQKTKIMASSPITSWQIDGKTVETVRDFILGGSKITADGDCNHEIKRRLLLGRKVMTNPDSILKSRDITLQTKVCLVKAMVFSSSHVWMWELDYKESWAPKNWCFWTVVLEKTLESPLDSKEIQPFHPKGNQSWIFIGRTDAAAEIQNFGHLMWRTDSFEKTLMLWKIEGGKRRGWQRMSWLDGITDSMGKVWVNYGSWQWTGKPGMLHSMGLQRAGHDWATELNRISKHSEVFHLSFCYKCLVSFCNQEIYSRGFGLFGVFWDLPMDQQVYLINSPHRLKTIIYSVCVRCSILLFKFPISLIFPTFSFMKEMYLNIKLYAIIIDMSISFNERQFLLLIILIFFHVLNFILNM